MKSILLITSLCTVGRAGLYPQVVELTHRGIQACPLPSAVLSTHTGGLGTPAKTLLGDHVAAALGHYLSLGVRFDVLMTGYLPEQETADAIAGFVARGGAGLCICDPVMADNGGFYSGMGERQAEGYRKLMGVADVVTPNLTEAAILLGLDPSVSHDPRELASKLATAHRAAVVTGGGDETTVRVTTSLGGRTVIHQSPRVEGKFIGTGDLFAAKLAAAMVCGSDVFDAAAAAADEVGQLCAVNTGAADFRYGMEIERA